ncbi:MAG: phosphopantetheine-binding protein [Streptococcus salivarius]
MQNDVVELIATVSGFETDEISYNDYLEEDLGFDSIMMIDLYQTILNSKLDLNVQNITKEKLRNDVTVADFLKLLGAKTNNEPQNKTVVGQLEEIQAFKEYFQTKASQIPYFKKNQGVARNKMLIDGNSYINFSTYNYLGLNGNQEVSDYAIDAIKKYGTSVSGSRLLSGEIEIHQKL